MNSIRRLLPLLLTAAMHPVLASDVVDVAEVK